MPKPLLSIRDTAYFPSPYKIIGSKFPFYDRNNKKVFIFVRHLRRSAGGATDIYLKGVYLTSYLLWFKLRNFDIEKEDEATVDVCGMCTHILYLPEW